MWVTTTTGDLVDVTGAWITRTSTTGIDPYRIVARYAVRGADTGWVGCTLGAWQTEFARDRVYGWLAKALRDGETDFDMGNP